MSEPGHFGTVFIYVVIVIVVILVILCCVAACGLVGPCSKTIRKAITSCTGACCGGGSGTVAATTTERVGLVDDSEVESLESVETAPPARRQGVCCGIGCGWVIQVVTCCYCFGFLKPRARPAVRRGTAVQRASTVDKVVPEAKVIGISKLSDGAGTITMEGVALGYCGQHLPLLRL